MCKYDMCTLYSAIVVIKKFTLGTQRKCSPPYYIISHTAHTHSQHTTHTHTYTQTHTTYTHAHYTHNTLHTHIYTNTHYIHTHAHYTTLHTNNIPHATPHTHTLHTHTHTTHTLFNSRSKQCSRSWIKKTDAWSAVDIAVYLQWTAIIIQVIQ